MVCAAPLPEVGGYPPPPCQLSRFSQALLVLPVQIYTGGMKNQVVFPRSTLFSGCAPLTYPRKVSDSPFDISAYSRDTDTPGAVAFSFHQSEYVEEPEFVKIIRRPVPPPTENFPPLAMVWVAPSGNRTVLAPVAPVLTTSN